MVSNFLSIGRSALPLLFALLAAAQSSLGDGLDQQTGKWPYSNTPNISSSFPTAPLRTGPSSSSSRTVPLSTGFRSSSITPPCAQTGCASCAVNSLPIAPIAECSNCTAINGIAYPPRNTTLIAGAEVATDPKSLLSSATSKRKRYLTTPEAYERLGSQFPYSDFFRAQLHQPGLIDVPLRPFGTGGSSSAVLRQLDSTNRLFMAVQGLYGCTSLILISRNAVYMSHRMSPPQVPNP